MCNCERIERLQTLKSQYIAEKERAELEYSLLGSKHFQLIAQNREQRIAVVEKALKSLKLCADCEARKAQEEELKQKKRDNWIAVLHAVADFAVFKSMTAEELQKIYAGLNNVVKELEAIKSEKNL